MGLKAGAGIKYLVSNDGFFYGSEIFEGGEEDVTPLRTADILDKATELLAQSNKDFVFVFHRFC